METIKINFGYFWPSFNKEDNFFTRVLSKKYRVELSDDPDLFIFTHSFDGKHDYLNYSCHRLFLGWENDRADWNSCDYVIDSDFYNDNPRHFRWPIWAAWKPEQLTVTKDLKAFREKKKFACMVVSNPHAKERIEFFNQLSKYKQVDSGGKYLNNVGGPVADKMAFIREYKFVISFENSIYPGYTTEKICEPMLVNSIPVYWGNKEVGSDFNTNSFVHVNQFASFEEAIARIIELDQNEEQYLKMAAEPWFNGNSVPIACSEENLAIFFDFVLNDMKSKKPVAISAFKSNKYKLKLFRKRLEATLYAKLGIHKGFR